MSEVINFLKENSLIYLATSGLDGNAKVRPILFYFEEDGTALLSISGSTLKNLGQVINAEFSIVQNFEIIDAQGVHVFSNEFNLEYFVLSTEGTLLINFVDKDGEERNFLVTEKGCLKVLEDNLLYM